VRRKSAIDIVSSVESASIYRFHMGLATGDRIGAYDVVAPLGAGGMGEVYRARDAKLGRDVAIKVLPDAVALDPDRVDRFNREARTLAALNHPHIAAIYGVENAGGRAALVLELVEGPTLADRIAAGPIPVDEALPLARQIADAVGAAHDHGIIHRDLKPANIKVRPDGTVKVLDFGLARAADPPAASSTLSLSPTLTSPRTEPGVILGTAAYMAPEQARGRAVDKRADVWAFGCVLFEMVSGRRAFEGDDAAEILAAIVRGEPDWAALPPDTPPPIHRLLRRCLTKDPAARLRDLHSAMLDIDDARLGPGVAPRADGVSIKPGSGRTRARLVIAVIVALLAGIAVGAAAWRRATSTAPSLPPTVRFSITPADQEVIVRSPQSMAISDDAVWIAYVATRAGIAGGPGQLMLRAADQVDARPVAGAERALSPFFSPDSRWLGYFEGPRELRKVSIAGGPSTPITGLVGAVGRGASWGPDGRIVFATSDTATGLLSVSTDGGEPVVLTTPQASTGERDHVMPTFLPDGHAVLFTILGFEGIDQAQVAVLDLRNRHQKTLIRGGSNAAYLSSGHLVYAAAGALHLVRFDADRLEVLGSPITTTERVAMSEPTGAAFAASSAGGLLYVPGGTGTAALAGRTLVWVDRLGHEEPLTAPPRAYYAARLSPDGARLALDIRDEQNDIWTWDVARRTLTRLTFGSAADIFPAWTADSRRLLYSSARQGAQNVYVQSADGGGPEQRITTTSNAQFASAISADGTVALLTELRSTTGSDVMLLPLDGTGRVTALVQTRFNERNADLSPDGRWLAYQSDESGGRDEIYVRPFPDINGGRWQISTNGGSKPVWSRSGGELFYLDREGLLTSVSIQATATFHADTPRRLLQMRYASAAVNQREYDVTADGRRFLFIKNPPPTADASSQHSLVIVLNWASEMLPQLR
jgi:eukaryotic-like serine/threonine-protein kinase